MVNHMTRYAQLAIISLDLRQMKISNLQKVKDDDVKAIFVQNVEDFELKNLPETII